MRERLAGDERRERSGRHRCWVSFRPNRRQLAKSMQTSSASNVPLGAAVNPRRPLTHPAPRGTRASAARRVALARARAQSAKASRANSTPFGFVAAPHLRTGVKPVLAPLSADATNGRRELASAPSADQMLPRALEYELPPTAASKLLSSVSAQIASSVAALPEHRYAQPRALSVPPTPVEEVAPMAATKEWPASPTPVEAAAPPRRRPKSSPPSAASAPPPAVEAAAAVEAPAARPRACPSRARRRRARCRDRACRSRQGRRHSPPHRQSRRSSSRRRRHHRRRPPPRRRRRRRRRRPSSPRRRRPPRHAGRRRPPSRRRRARASRARGRRRRRARTNWRSPCARAAVASVSSSTSPTA